MDYTSYFLADFHIKTFLTVALSPSQENSDNVWRRLYVSGTQGCATPQDEQSTNWSGRFDTNYPFASDR